MKKIYSLLICSLLLNNIYAQVVITELDGTPIEDEGIYTYSQLEEELTLKITNSSSTETVYVEAEIIEMNNASGTNLQFCLGGTCYSSIEEGNNYPLNGPLTLGPGEANGNFDHFMNNYPGTNTDDTVEYTVRFYETDQDGNEVEDILTFSYVYDSTLSVKSNTLENIGVELYSSIVTESLQINSVLPVEMKAYNITGKRIFTEKLNIGNQKISTSNFQSGIYILEFISQDGSRAVKKIVKK